MAEPFKPSNRFSDVVSIAAAAVEWHGLSTMQQELVVVKNGIPYLAGGPDLTQRAEAILEAAERRTIKGYTHTEDGEPLPAGNMQLDRDSLDSWIAKARKHLPPEMSIAAPIVTPDAQPDVLLKAAEAYTRLGVSSSTFYRWIREGKIEGAQVENPPRWRSNYIASLVAGKFDVNDDDVDI